MHAPLDVPRPHLFTVTDYHRMAEVGLLAPDARVELIEGEIIDMAPIGPEHGGTVNQLTSVLTAAVGERAIVAVQNSVRLSDLSEPEPDVALLRARDDFYRSGIPTPDDVLLMIEVAQSSLRYDRDRKLPLYARHAVPCVWLFDLNAGRLTLAMEPTDSGYASVETLDARTDRGRLRSMPLGTFTDAPVDLLPLMRALAID